MRFFKNPTDPSCRSASRQAAGFIRGITTAGCILLSLSAAASAGDRCQPPPGFPNPKLLATMQRGVNLPGWDVADVAARPSRKQLQALRSEGFTHIRLPLDNRRFDDGSAPAYVDAVYEQVIELLSLGYTVSLDLHPDSSIAKRFDESRAEGIAALTQIWMPLARMARSIDPAKLALELLNEPQIGQDDWMAAAGQIVTVLRTVVPEHTLVIGPSGPQRHEMLSGMEPLSDPNIVYAVHYYDPFLFTHQGANWGPAGDPLRLYKDLPFPAAGQDPAVRKARNELSRAGEDAAVKQLDNSFQTPWDEAMIAQAFDVMKKWAGDHSRPVIINEFGVLSFTAPRQSRLEWLATVNRLAHDRCLGWVHWDFKDGFGLIDPRTGLPDRDIMQALKNRN
jgi:endoglucanase